MRRVADHLGVSLPGLYHHVRNQQELLDLAASAALAAVPPPRYVGQSWSGLLVTYATYVRAALAAEPAILQQLLAGGLDVEGESAYVADSFDALVSQGFTPHAAMSAWTAVTELAMGSVSETQRERLRQREGRQWALRMRDHLSAAHAGAHPGLRALAAGGYEPFRDREFQGRLEMLIAGIAATYDLVLRPRVADAMHTAPKLLDGEARLGDAATLLSDPHVHAVPVIDGGLVVSVVERGDLEGMDADRTAASIGGLEGRTIPPDADLEQAHRRMVDQGRRRLAVVDADSRLLGLLCLKAHGDGFCTDGDIRSRAAAAR